MQNRQVHLDWQTRAEELKGQLKNSNHPAIKDFADTLPDKQSPLHAAIDAGQEAIFGKMLNYPTNLNILNARGQTLLELAIEKKDSRFVQLLVDIHLRTYRRIHFLPTANYQQILDALELDKTQDGIRIKRSLQALIKHHPDAIKARIEECASKGLFIEAWDKMIRLHLEDSSVDHKEGETIPTQMNPEIAFQLAKAALNDKDFIDLNWPELSITNKVQFILCLFHSARRLDEHNFMLRRALNLLVDPQNQQLPSLEELSATLKSTLNIQIDIKSINYATSYINIALALLGPDQQPDGSTFANLRASLYQKIGKLNHLISNASEPDANLQDVADLEVEKQEKIQAAKEADEAKKELMNAQNEERRLARIEERAARRQELNRKTQFVADFKKVYTALRNGQTSFFKDIDFLKSIEGDEVEVAYGKIMTHGSNIPSRTAKAIGLINTYVGKVNANNLGLFTEIHDYAYQHSGLFKRTKLPDLDLSMDQVKDVADKDAESRTAKIYASLR